MTKANSSLPPPSTIRGTIVQSEVQPGVRYLLERHVGEGGMGMAYLARRESPDGVSPVVVKVVLPKVRRRRVPTRALVMAGERHRPALA